MTNYRVGHRCDDCDEINEGTSAPKCRLCGEPVGKIQDICSKCQLSTDMNEDLQNLINQKRGSSKMAGDVEE